MSWIQCISVEYLEQH